LTNKPQREMLSAVEQQRPLAPGKGQAMKSITPDLPPASGYSDQPQGEVCPPVQTDVAAPTKTCARCHASLSQECFYRTARNADGLHSYCKTCARRAKNEWANENKEKVAAYRMRYRKKHPERIQTQSKRRAGYWADQKRKWRKNHPEEARERDRLWRAEHPDLARKKSLRAYYKARATVSGKLRYNLRSRIHTALNAKTKMGSTIDLIGCTVVHLRCHLESLFLPGMTWANYGRWHIDHVRPCCSFDLTDANQQKECFHYTNLQPLWAVDNLRKGGNET